MAQLAPPRPPVPVALADQGSPGWLQTRIWLWWMVMLTVLVTAWFCTLGAIPAIIALVTAKHVLVALLALAQDLRAHEQVDA